MSDAGGASGDDPTPAAADAGGRGDDSEGDTPTTADPGGDTPGTGGASAEPVPVGIDEARTLLEEMVGVPSPSGEEGAAAGRLVEFFEAHGRPAYRDEVGNVRAPGAEVLLTSHVDTVPGQLPVEIVDGVLHGRGSVDATGPLCSLAAAAVRTGAGFAGVVGEETDSRGARHLVADRPAPAAVVNGEPGGWDALTLGYRGHLAGTYTARTDRTHTARPEPNAVERALDWWGRLGEALPESGTGTDGPGSEGSTSGGSASDGTTPEGSAFESLSATPTAVAGGPAPEAEGTVRAELDVEFRLPPSVEAGAVRAAAESALCPEGEGGAGDGNGHGDGGPTVEWGEAIPAWTGSPRTPLARAFRAAVRAEGGEPRHVRKTGTADANLYADAWDCPVLTYGPGDSALDHTDAERLSLSEFDRSVRVIERAVGRLLD